MLAGRSIKEWIGLAAFVAVGLFAVKAYYGNSGSLAVTSESQAAPIDEAALSNYSRANYPRTYDTWGEDGVDRIKERESRRKSGRKVRSVRSRHLRRSFGAGELSS